MTLDERQYECPECGEGVYVSGESERAVCDCGAKLVLEVDYDWVGGECPRFVDCTKWVVTDTELAS